MLLPIVMRLGKIEGYLRVFDVIEVNVSYFCLYTPLSFPWVLENFACLKRHFQSLPGYGNYFLGLVW